MDSSGGVELEGGVGEVWGSTLNDTQSAATGFEPALNLSDLEVFFFSFLSFRLCDGRTPLSA